jgi:hypothetical protein
MATYMKLPYMSQTIGLNPAAAAPILAPIKADSDIGHPLTLSFPTASTSALLLSMSSPIKKTLESLNISSAAACQNA